MEETTITTSELCDGGRRLAVRYLDGQCGSITVKLLPVGKLARYFELQLSDEAALIELVCGQESGWADTLYPESSEEIIEMAHALNFQNAQRSMERRASKAEGVAPIVTRMNKLGA